MKKFLLLFSLLPFFSVAQENTFNKNEEKTKLVIDSTDHRPASVLVLTFEPKLYMSQIDKQLAAKNNLSFEQLVDRMRYDLAESVAFRISDKTPAFSLFQPKSDSLMKELHYAYTSVQYSYRPLINEDAVQKDPKAEKTEKPTTAIRIGKAPVMVKKHPEKKEEPGTRIENGQIVSSSDDREKFMDCDIQNSNLLNELNKIYNSKYFVFINQLDLLYSPESTTSIRIKVHYTCYNLSGKKIHASAAIKLMPANITDLKIIRNDYFYPLAIEIADKLNFSILTSSGK